MRVGDLVTYLYLTPSRRDEGEVGLVMVLDPEEIGDPEEVLVLWSDGQLSNHSMRYLEVISASR